MKNLLTIIKCMLYKLEVFHQKRPMFGGNLCLTKILYHFLWFPLKFTKFILVHFRVFLSQKKIVQFWQKWRIPHLTDFRRENVFLNCGLQINNQTLFSGGEGCLAKCTSVLPKYHFGGGEIHTFFIKIGSFFEIDNFDQNSSIQNSLFNKETIIFVKIHLFSNSKISTIFDCLTAIFYS